MLLKIFIIASLSVPVGLVCLFYLIGFSNTTVSRMHIEQCKTKQRISSGQLFFGQKHLVYEKSVENGLTGSS